MSVIIDGTSGVTTPGVVNTAGQTIATTLMVTGVATLGAGAVLGTPASGNLSNCTALNATQLTTGTMPSARLPAGCVKQVVSTSKTDTFATTSLAFIDITGLTVTTAPLNSTASKVVINVALGSIGGTANLTAAFRLLRGGVVIAAGDVAGSRPQGSFRVFICPDTNHANGIAFSWVDSPNSTAAQTYALQMSLQGGGTAYINRTGIDTDGTLPYHVRTASSITVMETL